MIKIVRTDSGDNDFIELVKLLDAYLAEKDGVEHAFYDQYNKVFDIRFVVVAYQGNLAVSCGAIKEIAEAVMEVKRMFTLPEHRGNGFAGMVVKELEKWAAELGCKKCLLETGRGQAEAISLIKKSVTGSFQIMASMKVFTTVYALKK